jgi:hypothetical protein
MVASCNRYYVSNLLELPSRGGELQPFLSKYVCTYNTVRTSTVTVSVRKH